MDSVTLVLSALVTGASTRFSAITTDAAKDSYQRLKSLIQRRFEQHQAPTLLASWEDNREAYELPLKNELIDVKIDTDEEVLQTAQKLLTSLQPQQAMMSNYGVLMSGNVQDLVKSQYQHIITNVGYQKE